MEYVFNTHFITNFVTEIYREKIFDIFSNHYLSCFFPRNKTGDKIAQSYRTLYFAQTPGPKHHCFFLHQNALYR